MTKKCSAPTPVSVTAAHSREFRLRVSIAIAPILMISLTACADPIRLQLTRKDMWPGDGGKAVEIVNTGSKPINIKKVTINDRTDCPATLFTINDNLIKDSQANFTGPIKVGDKITYFSSCRIIRTTVETDQGTETYSFASY